MRNNETLQKLEDGEPDDLIAEMDNVVSRSSALVDNLDGWETGGRLPAQHKSELKHYMRCNGLCCPLGGRISENCDSNDCNRCWCCFDSCFTGIDRYLIDVNITNEDRFTQIEEWFRSFNCWPLPLVTIVFCIVEIVYYVYLTVQPDTYNSELLASDLIWKSDVRYEAWRWFTYSLCHGSATHLGLNITLQILIGIFVEFEHKWVRTLIIYVLGVATGALFHSVVNPCMPLCGSSGGVYALMGAAIIKLKRHGKYKGFLRKWCNFGIAIIILLLAACDLGYSIYNWATCNPETRSTAISAHIGLSISYWLLNKFQESWGQEMFRYTGEAPYITDKDVACCNCKNCNDAWCNNADCAKLIRDPCAWIFMIFFFIVWIVCIIYNCTESPANGETCITPGAFNKCYMF